MEDQYTHDSASRLRQHGYDELAKQLKVLLVLQDTGVIKPDGDQDLEEVFRGLVPKTLDLQLFNALYKIDVELRKLTAKLTIDADAETVDRMAKKREAFKPTLLGFIYHTPGHWLAIRRQEHGRFYKVDSQPAARGRRRGGTITYMLHGEVIEKLLALLAEGESLYAIHSV